MVGVLKHFQLSREVSISFRETPERALLRSILGRAIYDLTPEATPEDRRDAIQWFRAKVRFINKEKEVTSFQSIKGELNLGAKTLSLIEETIKDAESFELYRKQQRSLRLPIDVGEWIKSRKTHRELNPKRGGGPATIRYRKASYVPRESL